MAEGEGRGSHKWSCGMCFNSSPLKTWVQIPIVPCRRDLVVSICALVNVSVVHKSTAQPWQKGRSLLLANSAVHQRELLNYFNNGCQMNLKTDSFSKWQKWGEPQPTSSASHIGMLENYQSKQYRTSYASVSFFLDGLCAVKWTTTLILQHSSSVTNHWNKLDLQVLFSRYLGEIPFVQQLFYLVLSKDIPGSFSGVHTHCAAARELHIVDQPLNKSIPYQCEQISQIFCHPEWGPVGMYHGSQLTTSLISFPCKPGNRGGPSASLRFVLVWLSRTHATRGHL